MRIGFKHLQDGRFFPLQQKGDTLVGSALDANAVIDGEDVAPKHARVRISDLGIELDDLSGAAQTAVNAYATKKHLLSNGDVVQIGSVKLVLELDARTAAIVAFCRRCNAEPREPLVSGLCRPCATRVAPRRPGSSTHSGSFEAAVKGSSSVRPGSSSFAQTVTDPDGPREPVLRPNQATRKYEVGAKGLDPTLVDPYVPIGVLGEGSQGRVYKLRHRGTGEVVAAKHLWSANSSKAASRFEREIKALQSLKHASIVGIIDVRRADNTTVLLMEHVEGTSLSAHVKKSGALPPAIGLAMASQIFEGLASIAALKIVHRDIKPSNVLVTPKNTAKLLDFGLVYFEDQSTRLTAEGQWIGTPHFMAPEQMNGSTVDSRCDLWGAAATFYFALTAKLPFDSGTPAELFRRITCDPVDLAPLEARAGKAVATLFERLLAKSPDDRMSLDEARAELARLARAAGAKP